LLRETIGTLGYNGKTGTKTSPEEAMMCDLCNGSSKCHLCEGEGFLKKAQHQGQITFYETLPCGGCFGSGLCVACQGREQPGAMAREEKKEIA
jgi:DnaJ-class molecular chaperone